MKKNLLLLALTALLSLPLGAVPPEHKLEAIRQSDGTTLMVYRHGIWRTEFFTTADGKVVVRSQNGDLCHAVLQGDKLQSSGVVAHELTARTQAEADFLASNAVSLEAASRTMSRVGEGLQGDGPRKAISASTADGLGAYGKSGAGAVHSLGDVTIPVIMVEFSDLSFKSGTTVEKMKRFYNEEGYNDESGCVGSVRDYFISQSGGMFRPTFDVVAKVKLSSSYKYYGSNDNSRGFINVVADAVTAAANKGVDFKQYDDGDGVPLVSILYAGGGEATGGGDDTLWPCEYDVNATWRGVKFRSLFIGNEVYGANSSNDLMGMGVFCHEFGHALGLPDFYCTNYNHNAVTMGSWSIMCSGCYLPDNHARAPIGYTAYERSYLGWLDIPELTEADAITLYPFGSDEGPSAVVIRNDKDKNEYFILQNFQTDTWYPSRFGTGLFVQRVAYKQSDWRNNVLNNTQSALRYTYISATGNRTGGNSNELFNGSNRTELTATSSPAMTLINGNKLNKPVYKIARDGRNMTFNFIDPDFVGHKVGDEVSDANLAYRFVSKSQVEVWPKYGSPYSGAVSVPASYTEGAHKYTIVGVADEAFANCPDLTSVSLPATVTKVAPSAFRKSPKLQKITVDSNNGTLLSYNDALYTNSEMITSPETATKPIVGTATFAFAHNPWALDVATNRLKLDKGFFEQDIMEENVTLTSNNVSEKVFNYFYSTGKDTLFYVAKDCSITFSVPEGTRITAIAFTSESFKLQASTGSLNGSNWSGSAQSVTFTASARTDLTNAVVTTSARHEYAEPVLIYYPAQKTGSYTLPTGITRIADYAFENTSLTSIVLSDSLQSLGANSLSSPSLTSLTAKTAVPPTAEADPFTAVDKGKCKLTVPAGSESAYKAAPYWQAFFGTTSINAPALSNGQPEAVFDLQGRRQKGLQKGINIVGGRKVLR